MDYFDFGISDLGVALYFLVGLNGGTKKMKRRYDKVDEKLFKYLGEGVKNPDGRGISEYIHKYSGYPVYENTEVKYFEEAIKGLDSQLHDLALARDFIFMEYHAIEDKEAWQKIQTVLEERVKAGVEVRVFYDDMGSIGFVNMSFAKNSKQSESSVAFLIRSCQGSTCFLTIATIARSR